jgi:NDP-sugar pyrophosphorylase family protein
MQIIIPMSGFGERFKKAGFSIPKPLIEVDGKSIISHVIDLFPNETNFYFICNENHLNESSFRMRAHLIDICPSAKIFEISSHKLGPVHAVQQIKHLLNPKEPTIVNYCDFTCYWDWNDFKKAVLQTDIYGAIPAYKGFHPHSLGNTNYAYIKEKNLKLENIQEKKAFTDNRLNEFASSGTYYFKSASLMFESFDWIKENDINVNQEFYVSSAYQFLIKQNLKTLIYPLQHFMQWGTPEDLAEYLEWSEIFRKLQKNNYSKNLNLKGSVIVPMAGLGKRFEEAGYERTKPLIEVSGRSMVTRSIKSLPPAYLYSFVMRQDMVGLEEIKLELIENFHKSKFRVIGKVTEGQAITALKGLKEIENQDEAFVNPITIAACDNAILFNQEQYESIYQNDDFDILVWGALNHVNAKRNPKMFGWIDYDKQMNIKYISVKKAIDDSYTHPIVTGMFTFKDSDILKRSILELVKKNHRINNEFYLDSAINEALRLGFKCKLFIVDHFISFGTPNDLKTFEYWQSCFSKWNCHPYQLSNDPFIPENKLIQLEKKYAKFN